MRWSSLGLGLGLAVLTSAAGAEDVTPAAPVAAAPVGPNVTITERPLQSADGLVQFAAKNPDAPAAERALRRAIRVRMRFGKTAAVRRGVERYRKLFAANRLQVAEVELAWLHYESGQTGGRSSAWQKKIDKVQQRLMRHSSPTIRWPAHVLAMREALTEGRPSAAQKHARQVTRQFLNVRTLNAHLDQLGDTLKMERMRRARALHAVGAAMFGEAELARRALAVSVPTPKNRHAFDAHLAGPVTAWQNDQVRGAERVMALYDRVRKLRAHGRVWQTRAAVAKFLTWAEIVSRARAAPYPRAWDKDGRVPGSTRLWTEVRATYLATLDKLSKPQRAKAKKAAEQCVAQAGRTQVFDGTVEECVRWLALNYPMEHMLIDEFRPNLVSVGGAFNHRPIR